LTFKNEPLAWAIVLYGFAASVLPIWLLLAPRDYLSTFMKLGTIFLLAAGIFVVLPGLHMPAVTSFAAGGHGPVFAGKLFPFCFIVIACGSISGFHSLIASGTTPKILSRESYARPIAYGAMCLESLVAILALIAACTLPPATYFSINMKGLPADTVAKVSALGYPISIEQMNHLAALLGEKSLFGRVGGAPTLAVGMATVFSSVFKGVGLALWYHFAIMFEALFILTTLDAGTRVGRYLVQDILGYFWKPLGQTQKIGPSWLASALMVGGWGWFLIQGVRDPLGGINSLWPLFGIANQLLASIALCLATTIVLKMQLAPQSEALGQKPGRPIFALITLLPLLWLLAVTMTAGVEKIFSADPLIGFLSGAAKAMATNRELAFNYRLDAIVTGVFLIMVALIFLFSLREWVLLLARRKLAGLRETPPVWLPEYAVAEGRPFHLFHLLLLALLLIKELSGEAAMERARRSESACAGDGPVANAPNAGQTKKARQRQIYLQVAEKRFNGVNRCC
jgi:carbon starvation protein